MRLKSNKRIRAFTLLEVLITVAILSCAIIFIFQSYAASLSAMRLSEDISLACYLAEDKLIWIEEASRYGLPLEGAGSYSGQNRDFQWRQEILDTDNHDLKELKLVVSWRENTKRKEYSTEFFTYLAVSQ